MSSSIRRAACLLAAGSVAVMPAAAQRGPAPAMNYLPPQVVALACAPGITFEPPPMPLRITGGQDSFARRIYGPGDLVTVNAGTQNGIDVGQEYYVRRAQLLDGQRVGRAAPATIQTTGWIRIYAVDDTMSLATIVHACDTIEVDDYLEPFALPQVPAPSPVRSKPERDNYGLVMRGVDQRRSFGTNDVFVVNRGADHGVTPGMHFVVYRDKRQDENFLFELGEAMAVDVKRDTSTLRVTVARDAITEGDYVAMRK
jgi:hypothetical protein